MNFCVNDMLILLYTRFFYTINYRVGIWSTFCFATLQVVENCQFRTWHNHEEPRSGASTSRKIAGHADNNRWLPSIESCSAGFMGKSSDTWRSPDDRQPTRCYVTSILNHDENLGKRGTGRKSEENKIRYNSRESRYRTMRLILHFCEDININL